MPPPAHEAQVPIDFDAPLPTPPTTTPLALMVARMNADRFTDDFLAYLPDNLHVYAAFEREALRVAHRGFQHYSARTIIEVLRHHSAMHESTGAWKLNDWRTPYLARLFALMNPDYARLFEFREVKAVQRDSARGFASA